MVGHSGKLDATVKATETVDRCLTKILETAEKTKAVVMVTADHGNCEQMIDPATGGPHTANRAVPTTVSASPVMTGSSTAKKSVDSRTTKACAEIRTGFSGGASPFINRSSWRAAS